MKHKKNDKERARLLLDGICADNQKRRSRRNEARSEVLFRRKLAATFFFLLFLVTLVSLTREFWN